MPSSSSSTFSSKLSNFFLNTSYVECLQKFDRNVLNNEDEDGGIRKYVGIVYNISSMIPVPDSELTLLDIDSLTDLKYKNMLNTQVIYIRKNTTTLQEDHAEVIYNQKTKNYPNIGYLNSTVDFKLLEQKMLEYVATKEIVEGKEQASAHKQE